MPTTPPPEDPTTPAAGRRRTATVVAVVTVVALAVVGIGYAVWSHGPVWAWRLADLDRNELHLGGVSHVEDGEVVRTDDASVVVRYTKPETNFFGTPTGEVGQEVCYRFSLRDPDDFRRAWCP